MADKAQFSSVFFRKYIFQAVIFLLCLLFLTVLSLSVCEKATESYAERERYRAAELNETVYSYSADYPESFYSFGGSAYAFTSDSHRMNADVLMTVSGKEYKGNPLYFKTTLSEGTCAISENLSEKFGIKKGDSISVHVGKDEKHFVFTVSEILPAQCGVDAKYMHEGVIILAESREFIETGKYIYVSFAKDWNAEYLNLVDDPARGPSVVFSKDLIRGAEVRLITYAAISTTILWIFIALCEILIFSKMGRKYRDYAILSTYGISKTRLFGKVLKDNVIKYLVPLVINLLIWLARLGYYHIHYLVPAVSYIAIGALTVIALTFITVMRKNRCQKIRR